MEFLPTTTGTRPRLAVEVRPEAVVAGRSEAGSGILAGVSRIDLSEGTVAPGLKSGNIVDRSLAASAVRRAVEATSKSSERAKYVTLIVPDAAVRVLLLDFDALPAKAADALPIVRFRLKKLLPFDVEGAIVSYQIMSSSRGLVQVLAVAIPSEVLAEYEGIVTEAGYLPGAVLPSTLASLAGLAQGDEPALIVNAGPLGVTTAIVREGVVLLHRTVDLAADFGLHVPEVTLAPDVAAEMGLPLVDRESSVEEWARQQPLPEHGRREFVADELDRLDAIAEMQATMVRSELLDGAVGEDLRDPLAIDADRVVAEVNRGAPISAAREIAQAVSVAAAYFEDTLGLPVTTILSSGTMGAERLRSVLFNTGFSDISVREIVTPEMLDMSATTASVGRSWLAGIRGALAS